MITNSEHLAAVRKMREFAGGNRVRITWTSGEQDAGTAVKPQQVLGELGFDVLLDRHDGDPEPSFVPVRLMEHLTR